VVTANSVKVVIEIKTLHAARGFVFEDSHLGGRGGRAILFSRREGKFVDFLKHGPLCFPVVDLTVELTADTITRWIHRRTAFQTAATSA